MFKRKHHQNIEHVLAHLNHHLLKEHCCYFGGGTAIALLQDEYRESVDIDFLVSDVNGYRNLRQLLTGPDGIHAISSEGSDLILVRELRADQYGIRTIIQSGESKIKFEIVLEGRILFDDPGPKDRIGNIFTLTRVDLLASKLLANSDRWNDDAVFSRDVIDLVMLNPRRSELNDALEKSYAAYGDSIHRDLQKAIDALLSREGKLENSMKKLQMNLPRASLWQKLADLKTNHKQYLNDRQS